MAANTKVILLEDDKTLVSSLTALLAKDGVEVFGTGSADEARDLLSRHRVPTIFVDCLLPGESGVDFVKSIRPQFSKEILDVVMMSGVLADPAFVKETLRDTGAVGFLKKPFENSEVLKFIRRPTAAPEKPHPRKILYSLFDKIDAGEREKRKAIEALEEIHGFDLPLIYSLLVDAKLSGHLNIVTSKGEVSGITFAKGFIVGVDIADRDTYLGKLLIESGYLRPEDLEDALNLRSTKKLGERLIQGNLLSPHGFNIVLSNQMSLRLSRTIVDEKVRVNFVPADVEPSTPAIDEELFRTFLHDWIAAKITVPWFKAHFTQWTHARFVKTSSFEDKADALRMPLATRLDGLVEYITSGKTLAEILEDLRFPEETLYKSLHFLLTSGVLAFEERTQVKPGDRLKLMRKMMQQFSNKNRLEIYDLMARMTNVSEDEPDQVYKEFMNLLGPEPVGNGNEMTSLYDQLTTLARSAYDFCRSGNREKLKEELLKGDVEQKLKAASLYEEAKNSLQRAQYREALVMLQKAVAWDPNYEKVHLYMAWAKLGALEFAKNKLEVLKEIELDMMQISPEDKFDSTYNFVNGLYNKARGDLGAARKAFEKAIAMDGSMIVARRELNVLTSVTGQKTDLLNADLKSLVGSLFNKKKSS